MKLANYILLSLIITCYCKLDAQDTLSIYFEFGKSKILTSQVNILNLLSTKFDLSEIDHVIYLGITDSIGNSEANLKLSKKRATTVAEYCKKFFPNNYAFTIIASGENTLLKEEYNRRVDIILFFKPIKTEVIEKTESETPPKPCFYIDYKLLHRSHKRTITKNKLQYVMLETQTINLKKTNEHYYATKGKNGIIQIKKLKWALQTTGKDWWATQKYVALIPKADYEKFKFFKLGDLPCNECSEDITTKKEMVYENSCVQVDRFLMHHLQVKPNIFNRIAVKIRVPKEYVDIESKYLIGCSLEDELIWKTKSGHRNKKYYYATLPIRLSYIENIVRIMECCKSNPEPSECNIGIIHCNSMSSPDKSLMLIGEVGDHFQITEHIPYATVGLSKCGDRSQVMLLAGTDINLSIYGSLRYQYNYVSFPFSILNPIKAWQAPGNFGAINRYGRLYIGTEIKTMISTGKRSDLLEHNLHLGIALVSVNSNARVPKIFIQCGIGYDYLKNYAPLQPYFIAQAGINFKIASLTPLIKYPSDNIR